MTHAADHLENTAMTQRYIPGMTVPKSVTPGQVLMHNNVLHTVDMPCGLNGFRAWTDDRPPEHFIECPCGWSGLPHYASREYVESSNGKPEPGTWKQHMARTERFDRLDRARAPRRFPPLE